VLTKKEWSGNISKHFGQGGFPNGKKRSGNTKELPRRKLRLKNFFKKVKKVLDKRKRVWYPNRVACEGGEMLLAEGIRGFRKRRVRNQKAFWFASQNLKNFLKKS
jgi:hypothetical protein